MNRKFSSYGWLCVASAAVAACGHDVSAQEPSPPTAAIQPAANPLAVASDFDDAVGAVPEDGAAMLRGPVHEAFAEQFSANPTPSEIIGKEPLNRSTKNRPSSALKVRTFNGFLDIGAGTLRPRTSFG